LSTGKYTLHVPFPTFVQEAVFDNGFALLAIEPRHTTEVIGLPYHHRDPFDRLIIAQAIVEQIAIVGGDPVFDQYGVRRIW
jgi:PIN domain nuclease of toxin-antitoxin system